MQIPEMPLATATAPDDLIYLVQAGVDKKATLLSVIDTAKAIETITANSALDPNKVSIFSTANPISCVLPNGSEGQEKLLVADAVTSTVTIVPSQASFTNVILNLSGQTATLKFISNKWRVVSFYGATVA